MLVKVTRSAVVDIAANGEYNGKARLDKLLLVTFSVSFHH
jgi:hypothetical protein